MIASDFCSMGRTQKILILVFWCVLLFPLIFLGYGSDDDAWLLAQGAHQIWSSGTYVPSRTTGFPVYELSLTPLVHFGGWYLTNLFSLIAGMAFLFALFRLGDRRQLRHPILSVITLSFLPVFTKNATSTMDYVPALSILLWSYTFMLERKWTASASLIGIACGFRPTSGMFLIPLLFFAYRTEKDLRLILKISLTTIILAVLAYSPVLIKYGLRSPYSTVVLNLSPFIGVFAWGYNSLRLFGIAQTVLLGTLLIYLFASQRKESAEYIYSAQFGFHVINIGVWLFLFVFVPDEPEYLMPLIPSLVFLIDQMANKTLFTGIAAVLLLYHFVQLDLLGGESGNRYLSVSLRQGFSIEDIRHRIFQLSLRRVASNYHADQPTALLQLGYTYIPLENEKWVFDNKYGMFRQKNGMLYISKRINNEKKMRDLKNEGFRLIVWRGSKWEYVRSGNTYWLKYIEVVDDLSAFFKTPVAGKSLTER